MAEGATYPPVASVQLRANYSAFHRPLGDDDASLAISSRLESLSLEQPSLPFTNRIPYTSASSQANSSSNLPHIQRPADLHASDAEYHDQYGPDEPLAAAIRYMTQIHAELSDDPALYEEFVATLRDCKDYL